MDRSWRLLVAVPLAGVLSWAALEAVETARSETLVAEATKRFASMPRDAVAPRGVEAVAAQLAEAERLDPGNPRTQELLGLLALREAPVSAEASRRFARSLALRPVSPNTWANFAEAKYREGDTTAMFELALRNAAALGPAEPQTQRMVAHYGLAVWDEVAAPTRMAIERMVGAGMRRNPLEMLQIAQRRGRLEIACRHLAGVPRGPDPQWSRVCQSTEARQ